MKLALVRRSFSAVGGAELYLQRLLCALQAAGHELHLYAESWEAPPAGVSLHRVPAGGARARRPWRFARAADRQIAPGDYDCVFSLERTLRQDVYRAGDGVHQVWVERRRSCRPWWRTLWTSGFDRAMIRLERETLNPANTRYIIANSNLVRNEIAERFGFPRERIVLVRNGIEVARFQNGRRAETRARFGFREEDFVCLFAGSGWERKGLRFVVQAVRRLRGRVKLLVVGKGRPFSAGPEVVFVGPAGDMENYYAAADLFTFVPVYEPSANVCIEAMAAGLPVVTSRFNGAGELIENESQGTVLPEPSDIAAIATEIEKRAAARGRSACAPGPLSLARNVAETLAVLELAARSR